LITGAAGVAGYNALTYFQARYPGQVVAIRQRDNWRLDGPGIVACNSEDHEGLERVFEEHRFAAVLDCAGNCALKSCELDPGMAWTFDYDTGVLAIEVPEPSTYLLLSIGALGMLVARRRLRK